MGTEPEILLGRYRVMSRIGSGGQGTVYEARRIQDGHRVAIKCADVGSGDHAAIVQRSFRREAALLTSLSHPGLPRVLETSVAETFAATVMEFVEGRDLAALRRERGAPFDVNTVLGWADQLLGILEFLHRQTPPILHRDLKPANLKVLPSGQLVLLDFGLARDAAVALLTVVLLRGSDPNPAPPATTEAPPPRGAAERVCDGVRRRHRRSFRPTRPPGTKRTVGRRGVRLIFHDSSSTRSAT